MPAFLHIDLYGHELDIEYEHIAPENPGPALVFLHEGLGSLAMWREFPKQLCEAVGRRGLTYSRPGYGQSTRIWPERQWPLDFMHVEAREILPRVLAASGTDAAAEPPVLIGHSDGASIALIYAAKFVEQVAGVVAMAPHIFVEDLTVQGIAKILERFQDSELSERLAQYHNDVDGVFWGWANVWLRPEFKRWEIRSLLDSIKCPVLAMQGLDDEYGSMAQIDGIAAALPSATAVKLTACAHSPHIDQSAAVIGFVRRFLAKNEPVVSRS